MVNKTHAVLSILALSLLLSACDDPNCFAGECVAGVPEPNEATEEYREYFFDVALTSGVSDEDVLLRFENNVTLRIHGAATEADHIEVERIIEELQELTGRQISVVDGEAVFDVHFIPRAEFRNVLGQAPDAFDGFIQIFYGQTAAIGKAVALIATELPGGADRRYVTRQLITRGFGLLDVSDSHPASIFHSSFNSVTSYALIDKFVIRTAYDPRIESGMTRAEITAALGW